MKYRIFLINLFIAVCAAFLFLWGIGDFRLFDWDEINFAESAREMVLTGDWVNVQINFEAFWEKPPLFIWIQALSMKVFGIGEFAARFPNAIIGVLTLLMLFNIGYRTKSVRIGLLWVMMYTISLLPFLYFKSGIIDPWFNFFIFLGIYFFCRYSEGPRMHYAALSAAATGLAVLTKGPVAFLVFGLSFLVWLAASKGRFHFRWKDVAVYFSVLLLVGGSWFIALAASGHGSVIRDFILYQIRLFETQDAGHGGFPLYHFVVLFFGVAPASVFALPAFGRKALHNESSQRTKALFKWMMVSFWVVLILFSIVRTKIVHYSSFCYFPLTFLAAWSADRMLEKRVHWHKYQSVLLILISILYSAVLLGLFFFDSFKDRLIPYIDDPFAVHCMEATSSWQGFEPYIGVLLVVCTISFCYLFRQTRKLWNFAILSIGCLSFLLTAVLCGVGEIEKYSQASAINFYIGKKHEDCYIYPMSKSYAHYFYSARKPENNCTDFTYLTTGTPDKPCYFVVKDSPEELTAFRKKAPGAQFLYRQTGYVFFVYPAQ